MARKSREEKQHRRAREELASALARQDAELAVTSLLCLPPQERAAELPGVAHLFHEAVARDHRRGDWSRLGFWAARVEREPSLLLKQDEAAANGVRDAAETRWPLLWACARSGLWDRARGHAAALAGRLPGRLQRAIDDYIAAAGAPVPGGYRDLVPASPADPRLGYDRGQHGVVAIQLPRQPERPEDVEPAVLACASLRSSRDFAAEIERWAAASPELATSILALAARIQRGEILARMLKGASSLDAAQSLASFLARLGPAEAIPDDLREILEDDAVLALRVASALVRSGPLGRKEATGADAILRVAARFPRLRPCVFALTLDCSFEAESIAIAQDLLEALCRLPDSGPLWLMALAIADSDGAAAGLPGWLTAGFAGLLRRPGDVASALAQLPADQRREVLESALQILPLEDAELFLEEAWARADDAMKPVLLSSLEELLDRASEHAGDGLSALEVERIMAEMASGMGFAPSRAEIRQMLSSPEGRQIARSLKDERGAEQKGTFPATARRIWVRFADRAIPCSVSYLELALEQDGSKLARMRAVERFLGHSAGDGTAMVDAVWSAEHARCRLASKALLEHLLGVLGGDRQKLAEALLQAIRRRLRQAIRGTLARAFASADARAAADGRLDVASPEILSARLEARLATTPRQARGRAPTASGRRRRGPRPAVQPGLFTFGDERG